MGSFDKGERGKIVEKILGKSYAPAKITEGDYAYKGSSKVSDSTPPQPFSGQYRNVYMYLVGTRCVFPHVVRTLIH